MDINFELIAPKLEGKRSAFEELVCQLARRDSTSNGTFTRLHGDGGDGGVECFWDMPNGSRVGVQAKYVFDIAALLKQAKESFETALAVHNKLEKFIVAFPFNLTGPTSRRGKSGIDKWDEWKKDRQDFARAKGRQIEIDKWTATDICARLVAVDQSGGIREYFFGLHTLSRNWFENQINGAIKTAGPRYTPSLRVETALSKWFDALGRTPRWRALAFKKLDLARDGIEIFSKTLTRYSQTKDSRDASGLGVTKAQRTIANSISAIDKLKQAVNTGESPPLQVGIQLLEVAIQAARENENELAAELEVRYGKGKAGSPGFRQFMAEYEVSFPTARLDDLRKAIAAMEALLVWLRSPESASAFHNSLLVTGIAGTGKTHGVCDMAAERLRGNELTCVVFGHEFSSHSDPFTRIAETLGLPLALGRNGILDALNAAGESSGYLLIFVIDAVNETRDAVFWRQRIAMIEEEFRHRPHLRLCVTCRSSFSDICIPKDALTCRAEHLGFKGIETYACKQFFRHYDLNPPVAPMLPPELSNPLYLRLVCDTLRARGLRELPAGWHAMVPVIHAFLEEKEKAFASEFGAHASATIIRGSLGALATEISRLEASSLPWSRAVNVVREARPAGSDYPVIDWLLRANLLIDDAPPPGSAITAEHVIRLSFERLGDFLVAEAILNSTSELPTGLCQPGAPLHALVANSEVAANSAGLIGVLSIMIPERWPGYELADQIKDPGAQRVVHEATIESLPWRESSSISAATQRLVRRCLSQDVFDQCASRTVDALLSICWKPSSLDALWFHHHLSTIVLCDRDSFWCGYLHQSYEADGAVRHLIGATHDDALEGISEDVVERWLIVLTWFTAAADRRVKDYATRSAVKLLATSFGLASAFLERFLGVDDDSVRERALLIVYGAGIATRHASIGPVARDLVLKFSQNREQFQNAIIRDSIRAIAELAIACGADLEPGFTLVPSNRAPSDWTLQSPTEDAIKKWTSLPRLVFSCTDDDFFVYTMSCLDKWEDGAPRKDCGNWIVARVADGFQYAESDCDRYDNYILANYGGGRGREMWAERIGKKYQWIALHQLASRLHDNIAPSQDSLDGTLLRTPLILESEREIDPTIQPKSRHDPNASCWWIQANREGALDENTSDDDWVKSLCGVPALTDLLRPVALSERDWRLMLAYGSMTSKEQSSDGPYRRVWFHVEPVLVSSQKSRDAFKALRNANFFGKWMPKGASWLYGFAGEYPWGTLFNQHSDDQYVAPQLKVIPGHVTPAWGELLAEWEQDASLESNYRIACPSKEFFTHQRMRWNGVDGFCDDEHRDLFRDPSVKEAGPTSLIADSDNLVAILRTMRSSLIWTLLGEKLAMKGKFGDPIPRMLFCQTALLDNTGKIQFGPLNRFDNG